MNRRGFTIVELIITISIMAILLTLGTISLSGSQANARDSERKTDIESVSQHLETYYTSGTNNEEANCIGGRATYDGAYTVRTFNTSGTLICSGALTAEVLVVAGGGGGGNDVHGGGGGGGVVYNDSLGIAELSYTVTVGAGGASGVAVNNKGSNGGNSVFSGVIAYGGGGGGASGASGGGGSTYTSGYLGAGVNPIGQGNNGGNGYVGSSRYWNGGGGGGASVMGQAATVAKAGNGGEGLSYAISGSSQIYGSGGGGGWLDTGDTGDATNRGLGGTNAGSGGVSKNTTAILPSTAAIANFGGGGGGGGWQSSGNNAGGAGGSGIVIVRYLSPAGIGTYPSTAITATSATITKALRDIDTESVSAPGITDPTVTFKPATNNVQTTAGVTPQPTIDQYVYQPLQQDGTLCTAASQQCQKFNLYYRLEADNTIYVATSKNQ